jgi:hypothetical protein
MRGKKAKALRRIVQAGEAVALLSMPKLDVPPEILKRARKRMLRHLKHKTK